MSEARDLKIDKPFIDFDIFCILMAFNMCLNVVACTVAECDKFFINLFLKRKCSKREIKSLT